MAKTWPVSLALMLRCPACKTELELVARGKPLAKMSGEILDQRVTRWHRERRVKHPKDERRTYDLWIRPRLGKRPVSAITRDEIEDWVAFMDESIRARRIRAGTAGRICAMLRRSRRDPARRCVVRRITRARTELRRARP